MFKIIKSIEEFNSEINNNDICVIDFFATWCAPCKSLTENLTNIVKSDTVINNNISKIAFIKVDVEEFEDLAMTFKISGLPHVIFYKNKKLTNYYVTGNNPNAIINIICKLLA